MPWRLLKSLSTIGLTSLGGISLYHFLSTDSAIKKVSNSWTTNHEPSVEWDSNWDQRASTSLVKSSSQDAKGEKVEKSRATRHIIMIRHGQYNLKGSVDSERILTELGRTQAKLTGQRLAELKLPIDDVVISTMARAQETGKIILDQLPIKAKIEVQNDSLIEEGAPIPPEPKVGHWRPEASVRLIKLMCGSGNYHFIILAVLPRRIED